MNKKENLCQIFAHGYVGCTILGIALLLPAYDLAMCLLDIGANSIYISVGVFLAANVNRFWGICAFIWSILFPVFLFISYLFALKKNYRMLFLAVALDTFVSFLFVIYTIFEKNWYGVRYAIVDLMVSFIILFYFIRILRLSEIE